MKCLRAGWLFVGWFVAYVRGPAGDAVSKQFGFTPLRDAPRLY